MIPDEQLNNIMQKIDQCATNERVNKLEEMFKKSLAAISINKGDIDKNALNRIKEKNRNEGNHDSYFENQISKLREHIEIIEKCLHDKLNDENEIKKALENLVEAVSNNKT